MRNLLPLLLLLFFCGCAYESPSTSDQSPNQLPILQSNDFLEVAKYLEAHPNTEHFNALVHRYFALLDTTYANDAVPRWRCGIFCKQLMLHQNGVILFDDTIIPLDSVADRALRFLAQPEIENQNPYAVSRNGKPYSKAHFELVCTPDSAPNFQGVFVALRNAITSHKQQYIKTWNSSTNPPVAQQEFDKLFARRIVLSKPYAIPPTSPPPVKTPIILLEEANER